MKNEFENLTRTSVSSLIDSGVIKSVTVRHLSNSDRLIARLKGEKSNYAEILIGRKSATMIHEKGGLSDSMIDESSIVLIEGNVGENLRFTTTEYTSINKIFKIEKDKKNKDLEAKDFSLITEMLKSYWKEEEENKLLFSIKSSTLK